MPSRFDTYILISKFIPQTPHMRFVEPICQVVLEVISFKTPDKIFVRKPVINIYLKKCWNHLKTNSINNQSFKKIKYFIKIIDEMFKSRDVWHQSLFISDHSHPPVSSCPLQCSQICRNFCVIDNTNRINILACYNGN